MQREEEKGTEMIKGTKRLRQAIKNQQDAGGGEFRLAYHDAEEIAAEIYDELLEICGSAERVIGRYTWAHGVPAPVDADGEVVPLTTEVMYDEVGREVQVNHFRLAGHNSGDRLKWRVREMSGAVLDLGYLHLARPDSWERLEEDVESMLRNGTCAYFGRSGRESCEGCQAFAIDNLSCSHGIVRDVLRRAKALAERDAKASTPQPSPHWVKEAGRA